eukprot:7880898-Alexandrium_andersonii.AAC.1
MADAWILSLLEAARVSKKRSVDSTVNSFAHVLPVVGLGHLPRPVGFVLLNCAVSVHVAGREGPE